ncbi:MAG: hypothetical protein IJA61_00035 [Clostridia bacterium]|nr:hypothetical protein [Clostridia bacterium]
MFWKFLAADSIVKDDNTIYGKFKDFLWNIAKGIDETYFIFIALGLFVVITLTILIVRSRTYEKKLKRSVKGINDYLKKNPYINDDSLISLNAKMKAAPKALRHSWQEYVLNRDKLPSEYMNTETVIDHPSKASGFKTCIRICRNLFVLAALVMAILLFSRVLARWGFEELSQIDTTTFIITSLYDVFLVPALLLILGFIMIAIFESSYSSFMKDLYYEYREFQGYLNKACTTMPPYIDYEILFTQKEIKDGISVLQEYLDKKAIQDQKEKEEQELNKQNYEKFDFDALGVEGSILLERAMTESEKYFNIKRNLVERRTSKEQEIANYSKNFDDVTKDFERKAQTIRESMNQITEQLNNTSVKIEANYLKKRYDEEQQKLQQLEKDHQLSEARFKKQQAELQEELNAIDEEVNSRKNKLEAIMLSEGKSYSNKIYGILNDIVNKQNEPKMKEMEEQKNVMQSNIDNMKEKLASYEVAINSKEEHIKELEKELGLKLAQIETIDSVKEYFSSNEFRRRVSMGASAEEYKEYNDVEELKAKLLHAEEQLMIANERQVALEKQTSSIQKEYENLKSKEKQLIKESKAIEKTEKVVKEAPVQKEEPKKKVEAPIPEPIIEDIDFDQVALEMMKDANEKSNQELVDKMQGNVKKLDDLNDKLKSQIKNLNNQKKNLLSSIEKLNSSKNKK